MAGIRQPAAGCVGAVAPGNMGYVGRRARIDMTFRSGGRYLLKPAMASGVVRTDWDSYIGEVLANVDEFDVVRRAEELRETPVLVVGGWRDTGPVLEDWIIPLVRALRGAGNDRVTPVVLDDDHGFGGSRDRLHETVVGCRVKGGTTLGMVGPSLVELLRMTREEWDRWTHGSAIRRAGYAGFKRNVAVAMGNWLASVDDAPEEAVAVLRDALEDEGELVREHAAWALEQ